MNEDGLIEGKESLRFELECPFCKNEITLYQIDCSKYELDGASFVSDTGALIRCSACEKPQAVNLGIYLGMWESAGVPVLNDDKLWIKAGYMYYNETGLGVNLRNGSCPDCLSPITEVEVVGGYVYEGAYVVKEDEFDKVIGCEKCKFEGSDRAFALKQIEFEEENINE